MDEMTMGNIYLYLLLVGAIALGWWLGRRSRARQPDKSGSPGDLSSRDYFIGLNYLLNDEPDDAVDIFIDTLSINSNTLETHLALATLLRRRGKVDRSIEVCQDLLGREDFSHNEINAVKINLVQSYIAAGLLDRAENLLEELRKEKGNTKIQALVQSAHVYQLEKEWLNGCKVLEDLLRICAPERRQKYQNLASHFYCELADEEMDRDHLATARDYLRLAVGMDKSNPRVSILLGDLEARSGNYGAAIKNYFLVKKQEPPFMANVFLPLLNCYEKEGKEKRLQKFINNCMEEENNTTVILELADYLEQERGREAAREYLVKKLNSNPSLGVLHHLLAGNKEPDEEITLSSKIIGDYIEHKPQYRCVNCGFEVKNLHWLCPSCSNWGTVKHLH